MYHAIGVRFHTCFRGLRQRLLMSRAYSLLLQEMGLVEIRRVERDILSHAVRFIESWSSDDAYQRFGSSASAVKRGSHNN